MFFASELNTLISYQLGIYIPSFIVTGFIGACKSLTLQPWWSGDLGNLKKSKKPTDESPNPCSHIKENIGFSGWSMMVLSVSLSTLKLLFII